MAIDFHPRSLKGILESSRGGKRLKNRVGNVSLYDENGNPVNSADGPILEMYAIAQNHVRGNSRRRAVISENSCNTIETAQQ